jgi:AcrR family transcriptional regulator
MHSNPRRHLIKVASDLFYKHGIRAVGVDRILAESGVAKATLYKHFRSKDELVLATLHANDPIVRDWLTESAEALAKKKDISPVLALFDVLGGWFSSERFRGCSFVRAVGEIGSPDVNRIAAQHKTELQSWIATKLEDVSPINAAWRAHAIMLLFDGAIVRALVERDPESADVAKRAAASLISKGEADNGYA